MLDGVLDGLIVTQLEMQERMMLDGAPMPSIERVGADEVQGACDPAARALRHDQQDAIAHRLTYRGKERARQIGPPPFPRSGMDVEVEECIPDGFGEGCSSQPLHGNPGRKGILAFTPDDFSFSRGKRGEKSVEAIVARIA